MTETSYKPLFNRRYLFALMWIIPIVILLLHATGREKPITPLAIAWQSAPDHWRLAHEGLSYYQLHAVLSLPPNWSLERTLSRAKLIASIEQWIADDKMNQLTDSLQGHIKLHQQPGLIKVALTAHKKPNIDQIQQFQHGLEGLSFVDLEDKPRLTATWQLDQRQAEQRLLAEFESWLFNETHDKHAWQFMLSGPDIEQTDNTFPKPYASSFSSTHAVRNLQGHVRNSHHLFAWQVPLSNDAKQLAMHRASVQVTRMALDTLSDPIQYRLIWNPFPPKSYLVVIVEGEMEQPLDEHLRHLLTAATSDKLLSDVIYRLQSQHPIPSSSPKDAIEWFELASLLRFSPQSDLLYVETLNNLSVDDLRQHIFSKLEAEHQLHVSLQPY